MRSAGLDPVGLDRWSGSAGAALYSNGTASLSFVAVEGQARLELQVKGEPAAEVWPHLRSFLNGRPLAEIDVNHREPASWIFDARLRNGENTLEVEYTNDLKLAREDRNAFLGPVTIHFLQP